jgi:MHS family shikimate/dehydroshikimate transporter-like MFS transporter
VFVLVYATQHVGMRRQTVLDGILIAAACALVAIPFFGALSDRLGRRPVYLFGAIVTGMFAYPLFWLLDTGSTPLVWLALVVALVFAHSPMYGPQAAFLSEMFGTRVRYSGVSLGSQLASYLIAMALVTIVAVLMASETRHQSIDAG